MSTIINLCLLDLKKFMAYKVRLICFFVISLILIFIAPQGIYVASVLLSYFIGITLISLDEQYHSNYLYGNLPISRKQIVVARYLYLWAITTLVILLLTIVGAVSPFGKALSPYFFSLSLICYSIALIFLSVMQAISFYFKFSAVRYLSLIIYILLFSLYRLVSISFEHIALPTMQTAITILFSFAIFCYLTCAYLAFLLYRKKQFLD